MQLPVSQEVLATLLNVHIVGGTTDLGKHLHGIALRPAMVTKLINLLRGGGYVGHNEHGINSREAVAQRMRERYERPYNGEGCFIPTKVLEGIERTHSATLRGPSLIQDKVATPAEPAKLVENAFKNSRPMSIAAEGSSSRMTDRHDEVS